MTLRRVPLEETSERDVLDDHALPKYFGLRSHGQSDVIMTEDWTENRG